LKVRKNDIPAARTASIGQSIRHGFPRQNLAQVILLAVSRLRRLLPVLSGARQLRKCGLFDREWYLKTNPDLAGSTIDPLKHFLRWGAGEGRDPNPLFDTSFYLERNSDVAAAGMNPLLHYLRYGSDEGRDPSPAFDTSYYARHNPDVVAAGLLPLAHYLATGRHEGRVPKALPREHLELTHFDASCDGIKAQREADSPQSAATSRAAILQRCRERGVCGPAAFVVGLSMVKNEEDVVEAFVRHNLQFLDALFVADNDSTDATRSILIRMEQEGLPVIVFDDPIASFIQSEKMTRFLRGISSTVFPDFLVPLDADEFIRCESRTRFLDQLECIPAGGVGYLPWVTYVVTPADLAPDCDDPLRQITHRRREEKPRWNKAIVRLDRQYSPSLVLTQGNHDVLRLNGDTLPSIALESVALAHFPVRSAEQLTTKVVVGWMAYMARGSNARQSTAGFHWRDAFDLVLAQGEIPRNELPERSMLYAQEQRPIDWSRDAVLDPMPFTYARSYGSSRSASRGRVLATVAKSWEKTLASKDSFGGHLERIVSEKRAALERDGVSPGKVGDTTFDASWHLTHPFVDLPPYRYLAERFRPFSVLDVGCGLGATLLYLQSAGVGTIMGIDGFPGRDAMLPEGAYAQHDLSKSFDAGGPYDLVICTEVAEHLPAAAADALLATLARHAQDLILFSAAEIGQPGLEHITCRPIDHWLERWRELGWEPDVFASLAFRSLSTLSWLRRNPLVLRKAGAARSLEACAAPGLAEIGAIRYRWYSQEPQVYDYPFTEEPPAEVYPNDQAGESSLPANEQVVFGVDASTADTAVTGPQGVAASAGQGTAAAAHWCRIVMDAETDTLVRSLDYRSCSVLEVSGDKWRDFGFRKYTALSYPQFDLCEGALDEQFDLVIAEQVFEHLLWPYRAGRNVFSMLKPGGYFLITTPFLLKVHAAPDDCSRWTETGIRHLLSECGFALEKIRSGSWGNRECAIANFSEWRCYDPQRHSLRNDPELPIVVWALARA